MAVQAARPRDDSVAAGPRPLAILGPAGFVSIRLTARPGATDVTTTTPQRNSPERGRRVRHDQPATLEAAFMTYTGRSLDDDLEEEATDADH
jgi:hypothetical protein